MVGCGDPAATLVADASETAIARADVSAGDDLAEDATVVPPSGVERIWIGVERLPENLMGAATDGSPLLWAVPRQGFELQIHAVAVDPPSRLAAVHVQQGSQAVSLAAESQAWTANPDKKSWHLTFVAMADQLTTGQWQFSAQLESAQGTRKASANLVVADRTADIDPFEAVDPWLLSFNRDLAGLQVVAQGEDVTVITTAQPNGKPDFDETLAGLGLQGGDAVFNQAIRQIFRQRVRRWLHTFFVQDPATGAMGPGSIRVKVLFDGDDLSEWPPAQLSKMAIGGLAPPQPNGKQLFGLAKIDPWNAKANDDSLPGYGVFTFSFVKAAIGQPIGLALLRDLLPIAGGKPFGSLPEDAVLLDPNLESKQLDNEPHKARIQLFLLEMRLVSLAVAAVAAHEIGHSLGLIHPGLPPQGLLGGVPGPWVVKTQDEHHLDTAGPNLMQTGDSFDPAELLANTPFFGPVESGYLRRRLLVLK